MSLRTIRNLIVSKLYTKLNIPVVPSEQTANRPLLPFLTYKFIVSNVKGLGSPVVERELVASADPLFEYDIKEISTDQPLFTISFCAYAGDSMSSSELALAAKQFIECGLYYDLKDAGAVVVNFEAIGDRTVLIVDNYEYRYGFDVIMRSVETSERTVEGMENIILNAVRAYSKAMSQSTLLFDGTAFFDSGMGMDGSRPIIMHDVEINKIIGG